MFIDSAFESTSGLAYILCHAFLTLYEIDYPCGQTIDSLFDGVFSASDSASDMVCGAHEFAVYASAIVAFRATPVGERSGDKCTVAKNDFIHVYNSNIPLFRCQHYFSCRTSSYGPWKDDLA